MKFKTQTIRENAKIISTIPTDFVYLDVENNTIYFANEKHALQLHTEFEDVKDDEKKVFVIKKQDFMHTINFAEEINLKANYKYIVNQAKGIFAHNEELANILTSIRVMFTQKDTYVDMFTLNENLVEKITRGSIFISGEDKDIFKNLNIQNKKVFSSSLCRIYSDDIDVETDGIIPQEVVKSLLQLGVGTKVMNNENSYLVIKDDISVYYSTPDNLQFIPLNTENFQKKYLNIKSNTNDIVFNTQEFLEKLGFITYYACAKYSNNPNNLVTLKFVDNKCVLLVGEENSIDLDYENFEKIEEFESEEDFVIHFNSIALKDMVSKLGNKKETFTLHKSQDFDDKFFVLSFGGNEDVILTMLNI